MAKSYLDTFTSGSSVKLSTHTADSGFTWTVPNTNAWYVNAGNLSGLSGYTNTPATFALDSANFTATFTMAAFSAKSRLVFGYLGQTNYLYVRHDGVGNVKLGRFRPNYNGSNGVTDTALDTWTIPDQGAFAGTVVITRAGDQVTVVINGTSHTVTTVFNSVAGGLGFDVESGQTGLLVDQIQVDTVDLGPGSTYLDTFTATAQVYLNNDGYYLADSGFAWTTYSSFTWSAYVNWLSNWSDTPSTPVTLALDSTAFTATITFQVFGPKQRIIFRGTDRYNYLYVRQDGATGTVTFGRRSGDASAVTDEVLDTWTIPERGGFAATVVITAYGDDFTVDINSTTHTTTTKNNRLGTLIGFETESGGTDLTVDTFQVVTTTAPPPPPTASWDVSAFDGGSPITGYTLHMRTLAGDELAADGVDASPSLDLTPEMLAASGWFWVTASNAVGVGQASSEVFRVGLTTFHSLTQAQYDAAVDASSSIKWAQQYLATTDFLLTSVKIKGDPTGTTVEIHDPFTDGQSAGLPGTLLASIAGDTEVLELAEPLLIHSGQRFVVQASRTAATFIVTADDPLPDGALTPQSSWKWSAADGYFMVDATWFVTMQLGLA